MELSGEAFREAHRLTAWLDEHHPGCFQFDVKNDLAVGWLALALEHRAAVILLAESGAHASAAALLRSEWEAFMRGC